MTGPVLNPAALERIAGRAAQEGLLRLGIVRVDHPGFEPARAALDRFLDRHRHGEMEFMARTREVRKHPERMLEGAASLLVVTVPYRGGSGSVARYARAADYHTELHARLETVAAAVVSEAPAARTMICVDTKPLLERAAAALAGLGFVGKHGCLIVPGLGSMVLLGSILTDARWEGHDAVTSLGRARWDACGSCRRCLDACPTDAFVGPGELDARRCLSYLTIEHRGEVEDELMDRFGSWVAGCDVCQEVCPYNASRAREARVPAAAWLPDPPGEARDHRPVAVAALGSARYRAFVKGTALRRIPRRALRRNALIALGNATGPLDADEDAAIAAAERDPDPQVARAATRARQRRGPSFT